jgi:hypothetical protein
VRILVTSRLPQVCRVVDAVALSASMVLVVVPWQLIPEKATHAAAPWPLLLVKTQVL